MTPEQVEQERQFFEAFERDEEPALKREANQLALKLRREAILRGPSEIGRELPAAREAAGCL